MNGVGRAEILGMACRLPGASDMGGLWRLLAEGRVAIGRIGDDRWPVARYLHPRQGEAGKTYTVAAGVLDDIWGFDNAAFRISPREAVQMDPQQRLLLELTSEALEASSITSDQIAGGNVGVYVGASGLDYGNRRFFDIGVCDGYMMTGNTLSLISNRISHAFDLKGPSFTLDTACSSSLVALNQALEGLSRGEVDFAVVGGVNMLLTPFPFIGFSAARMLSPEGLCRPFDARGQGYVRAEGGVVAILAPPGTAARLGRPPLARIVASRVNSDGRTNGISFPSMAAQRQILLDVYEAAGIDPSNLAFIEAHGTGTPAGDPVEAQAIGEALGRRRSDPLPIGSIKGNIGHLEPAAGLAGLAKAALALRHDLLPATVNSEEPSPAIPFEALNIRVAREPLALSRGVTQRYAGVSTFGFGGTNAHVILTDGEPAARRAGSAVRRRTAPLKAVPTSENASAETRPISLLLSAHTEPALKVLAGRYAGALDGLSHGEAGRLAAAALHRRSRLPRRLLVRGADADALRATLTAFAAGREDASAIAGTALVREGSVAFVFTGNGAQWPGMGRQAYRRSAAFRQAFGAVDRLFAARAGWSLAAALEAQDLGARLKATSVAQPLLFAVQVALVRGLAEHGVTPFAVLGHSVGEVAAAHAAGILDLEEAVRVIHARSQHQEIVRGAGRMAALQLGESDSRELLAANGLDALEIAAVNSSGAVTIAGPAEAIAALDRLAATRGVACRVLDLDYPFHSRALEPMRAPLAADLLGLATSVGTVPFYSTVSGGRLQGNDLGADYWWENVRRPVRFAAAVGAAARAGASLFLEIGPRPILGGYIAPTLDGIGQRGAHAATLEIHDPEGCDPVARAAAKTIVRGALFDATALVGPPPEGEIELPSYPWQRAPFRVGTSSESTSPLDHERFPEAEPHGYLGWRDRTDAKVWHQHFDTMLFPGLADHKVGGRVLLAGAALLEMVHAAGCRALGKTNVEVHDVDILSPLELVADQIVEVRTSVDVATRTVEIASRIRQTADQPYQIHVTARIGEAVGEAAADVVCSAAEKGAERAVSAATIYAAAAMRGLDYGPQFQRLSEARRTGPTSMAATLLAEAPSGVPTKGLALDPVLLDAAFHGLFALWVGDGETARSRAAFVPVRFGRLTVLRPGEPIAAARLQVTGLSVRMLVADFLLLGADGAPVARLDEARFRAVALVRPFRLEDHAYHRRLVPVAIGRDGATMPELGVAAASLPTLEPAAAPDEDPRLLLDVAARRAAYDALQPLFADGTPRDAAALVAAGRIPPAAQGLVERLLARLVDADLAHQTDAGVTLAGTCELPRIATIVRTIVARHPAYGAEAALMAAAPPRLAHLLGGGGGALAPLSPHLLDQVRIASVRAEALGGLLAARVEALAEGWPASRPLRIAVAGEAGGLTRRLARLVAAGRGRLVVAAGERRALEQARLAFRTMAEVEVVDLGTAAAVLAEQGPFDLGIAVATTADTAQSLIAVLGGPGVLAAGARLLAAAGESDAFSDLIAGLAGPRGASDAISTTSDAGQTLAHAAELAGLTNIAGREAGALRLLEAVAAPLAVAPGRSQSRGAVVVVALDAASRESALAADLAVSLADNGRVVVWQGDEARAGVADDIVVLLAATTTADPGQALASALHAIARGIEAPERAAVRFTIVIHGGECHALHEAARAFLLTAANEHPGRDLRLIRLAPDLAPDNAARHLAERLVAPDGERDLVIGRDGIRAARVVPGLPGASREDRRVDGDHAVVLALADDPRRDRLAWQTGLRRAPGRGEVEIRVAATGLNYRDVMWSLGLLPDEALEAGFAGPTLGFECAGEIAAVGEGVRGFAVGQRVVAVAPAAFATHVTVAAEAVTAIPDALDATAAATVPVAFLTAWYGLKELASLKAGEWVLIHGGAGGVGLAAIQIADLLGARVIATAGTPEKRALLEALGVAHVLDSRSLAFAGEVRRLVPDGVDVVLNSLAGEAMEASLALVRPFGRFLELGKRDFYANTRVGMRPFRRNVSYFGIDADELLKARPAVARRLLGELMEHFAAERLTPLPYRRFPADEIDEAFRLMQQSGHIGKIIVTPPERMLVAGAALPAPEAFRVGGEGFHIVAGGLGGLGLAIAEWLARHGARHVVLLSRSGRLPATAEADAEAALAPIRAAGAEVRVEKVDIAEAAALGEVLARLRRERPIRGIVHAAMVLDDAPLARLDAERIARVLRPKVTGAHNLDRLTRGDDLEMFVLLSSVAALIGNPGQAAYAAANGYLEGLAGRRRAAGLPALALGLGAITDVGFLARNAATAATIARRTGSLTFTAADALAALARLLARGATSADEAVVTVAPVDWSAAGGMLPVFGRPMHATLGRLAEGGAEAQGEGLADLVRGKDAAASHAIVGRVLAEELARVLRMPVDDVALDRPLSAIGLDSLMGLELRAAVQRRVGFEMPLAVLTGATTLTDVARHVVERLAAPEGGGQVRPEDRGRTLLHQHLGPSGALTEAEAALYARHVSEQQKRLRKVET